MSEQSPTRFSSAQPIIIYTRPAGEAVEWQEFDRGPGIFTVPEGYEIRIRIKGINDVDLAEVVRDLEGVEALRFLDLSENRNITNEGMKRLKALPQLTGLNLSSCSITNTGVENLTALRQLSYLNLVYCTRLSDPALKTFEAMRALEYVDLKGCLGFTQAGFSKVRRRTLTIIRK